MFRCESCNQIFEDPQESWEKMGEHHGQPAWEPVQMCPFCGSTDFNPEQDWGRIIEVLIRLKDSHGLDAEERVAINAVCNELDAI